MRMTTRWAYELGFSAGNLGGSVRACILAGVRREQRAARRTLDRGEPHQGQGPRVASRWLTRNYAEAGKARYGRQGFGVAAVLYGKALDLLHTQ